MAEEEAAVEDKHGLHFSASVPLRGILTNPAEVD
jgi:hypothetical protein